jgi:ABC-type transport system involved in multi-copper enzyme maturation permease subunit
MNPGTVLIIARLTLREAVRRRLLWSLVALTGVIIGLTWWAMTKLVETSPVTGPIEMLGVSQVLVLLAFMFSFVLAMTAVFAASPAIGPEIETGLLLAMLARPLRRGEVVLGRWFGLAIVVIAYSLAGSYAEVAVVGLATGYLPLDPWIAPLYLSAETLILLTLALALSTRIASVAGGSIAVVGYGLAWMAGVMGGLGEVFHIGVLSTAGTIAHLLLPSDLLWKGAAAALTPSGDVLNAGGLASPALYKFSFLSGSYPEPLWLAWCALWVAGMLAIATWSLRKREI